MIEPTWERDGIKLFLADCRDVLPHLGTVDAVVTDPPYGISLEVHSHNRNKWGKDWFCEGDEDQKIGIAAIEWAFSLGLPIISFASPERPWPGPWQQFLVWDKGPAVGGGGNKDTHWKKTWELIQVANTGELSGQRDEAVLKYWVSPNFRNDFEFHMCQKPVGLLGYLIGKATSDSAVVLDPFMGSGSTIVAALRLGRRAIGIEKEERYFAIAVKRIENELNAHPLFEPRLKQGSLLPEAT